MVFREDVVSRSSLGYTFFSPDLVGTIRFKRTNQFFNTFKAHSVDCITVGTCRHISGLTLYIIVSQQKHVCIVKNPVEPFKSIIRTFAML